MKEALEFVLVGAASVALLLSLRRATTLPAAVWTAILILAAPSLWFLWYMISPGPHYLGSGTWYHYPPWKYIILYLLMIAGMLARAVSQAIEARRRVLETPQATGVIALHKSPLSLDVWELVYPLLFSFITFGVLLTQVRSQLMSLEVSLIAFQNGFFWQTLLRSGFITSKYMTAAASTKPSENMVSREE
jgi:hypothetical protein